MLTPEQKKELEALKAKAQLTEQEKARLTELEALVDEKQNKEEVFSEAYVKELRNEAAKYRAKLREAEGSLAKFDNVDPEQYKKLIEEAKKTEEKILEGKGEWDKLRNQLVADYDKVVAGKETTITEKDKAIAQLEADLASTVLSYEISAAASMADAINPKLVEMVAKGLTKVERLEDGSRVVKVLDADKNPRVDLKTGKPFTIVQMLEEMKQMGDYAHLFKGGKAGTGSNGDIHAFDGANIQNPWKRESFNLTLQGKIVTSNPELASRLKAQAGVK